MARVTWAHTIQTQSPISRKLCLPTSIIERVLSSRKFSINPGRSSSSRPSSCRPRRMVAAAVSPAPGGRGISSPLSPDAAAFACHQRLGRLSSSALFVRGVERAHISTVAGRATAGSEVGVGSGSKNKDREILVQHLLVNEDEVQLLVEIQRKIAQEGLDLSDLATEHSNCPSKAQGGMLGWLKLGQTDPAFEEAAFNAPLNKLVRVKTKHGWHLLQVLNERRSLSLEQIQVEQFHDRMQDPSFLEEAQLIDVREADEISTASIKGFEAYPLSQFSKWAPNIADDLDPEKETYVLCHHGMRSMQAASWLQSQGFSKLYNIVGGIHAYSKRVDSSVPTY